MRFARFVFAGAGIYGIAVLVPLYFRFDQPDAAYTPPLPYPLAYHGFVGLALAWQIGFLIIGSDPARFRPMMLAAMVEKAGYVIAGFLLYWQGAIAFAPLTTTFPDAALLVLFAAAFFRTRRVK